ncbi:MAG: hypothetical protein PHO18_00495 [Synergistaceae bacterium]|nr:hypothetical protein [Synergistaceae bacterium]
MKKLPVLTVLIFLFLGLPAFADTCSTQPVSEDPPAEKGLPLEFINHSESEIKEILISETGRNIWSENLLQENTLKSGESASLIIKRESILGLTDIKIIFSSGQDRLWRKLPILEIFEITISKDGEPRYERIKLGA